MILSKSESRPVPTSKIVNMPLTFLLLKREEQAIYLVYNPRSNRIVLQWSGFTNGNELFKYKHFHDVVSTLMGQGWSIQDKGEYE
jgi:hypothetical protein